jgi:hypothetical protein
MPPSRDQGILGFSPPFAAPPSPSFPVAGESDNDGILPRGGESDPIPLLDTPTPKPPAPPAAGGSIELTLLGDYANPWKSDPATEAKLAAGIGPPPPTGQDAPHWSPATDTFEATANAERAGAGTIVTCADLDAILDAIVQRPDGAIKRVNIITHGKTGGLGMKGEIKKTSFTDKSDPANSFVPGDVFFTTTGNSFLTVALLSGATGSLAAKRDQARLKFAPGAGIFLYACDAASDSALIQAIAKFFKVPVNGFGAPVGYFPETDSPKNPTRIINRTKTGVDNGSGKPDPLFGPIVGFKHLNNEPTMFAKTENP